MSSQNRDLVRSFLTTPYFLIHNVPYSAKWRKIMTIITGQEEEVLVPFKKKKCLFIGTLQEVEPLLLNFWYPPVIFNLLPSFCSGNILNLLVHSDLCTDSQCLGIISLYNRNIFRCVKNATRMSFIGILSKTEKEGTWHKREICIRLECDQ